MNLLRKTTFFKSYSLNVRQDVIVNPRRDDNASHVVLTQIPSYMLKPTWMFMDRMITPINVHSSYKRNIVYKTWQQTVTDTDVTIKKNWFSML